MTDEYTPDLFDVQIAYVYADDYSRATYEERKEAFNRFIRKEKADAWDEAVKTAHLVDTVNLFYIDHDTNPYL